MKLAPLRIAAHTKNTLEPKWSNPFHIGNISYSSPAIGEDGTIYIGTTSGALVAVKNDGTDFKWIFHTDLKFGNSTIISSPAVGNTGDVYFILSHLVKKCADCFDEYPSILVKLDKDGV